MSNTSESHDRIADPYGHGMHRDASYPKDLETGLVALPPGQFWRVTDYSSVYRFRVQAYQGATEIPVEDIEPKWWHKWFPPKPRKVGPLRPTKIEDEWELFDKVSELPAATATARTRFLEAEQKRAEHLREDGSAITGDYPPKSFLS